MVRKCSTSYEGTKINGITSQFGMQQLINEPTHILRASSSCNDLIFVSQPNLVMESGVHLSLDQKYHYQIIYVKLNLKIHYPSPYECEIWHYKYAVTDFIQRAISYYPCERSLAEKDVNEKVYIFNKTIKHICSNFIPHETVLCGNRDPLRIRNKIKKLINEKNNEKNTAYQGLGKNEVKMSNCFKFFRLFKICYYLQLKLPSNNITRGFLKN